MPYQLRDLIPQLRADPWRSANPFSSDLGPALEQLHQCQSDEDRAAVIAEWLALRQPCIFGRMAARRGLLSYCFLTPEDVQSGDDLVRDKIQENRRNWYAAADAGQRSGFVISVLCRQLDNAEPDLVVERFARRLLELYLLEDSAETDHIYLDRVRLEAPLKDRPTWEWDVGVNYFSAQGDRRWWHDHRFPVGIALSMNSVGHMVKATHVARTTNELKSRLSLDAGDDFADVKLDSLAIAHGIAMKTIANAAPAISGPATWLLPHPGAAVIGGCPHALPPSVADKNFVEYRGYYHTDITLPSVYFKQDVERSAEVGELALDFTYLVESIADPIDRIRVGEGRRVRDSNGHEEAQRYSKFGKARPRNVE